MRISPDQAQAIVEAARAVAGADAQVSLFGSRLDDSCRGGDIDVLVQLTMAVARPAWLAAQITARLQRALGDRKVDVLIVAPGMELQAVHRLALREGVVLS
jgi:predicted nucleotidyltransferase